MESKNFLNGFLVGAMLGIGGGILLATSTSGETRKKLVEGAKKVTDSLGDTVSDTIGDLKEQFNEGVDQVSRKGKGKLST